MIKIDLQSLGSNTYGFLITTEKRAYITSSSIAKLFNLSTDIYSEILTTKVIRHTNYKNYDFLNIPYFKTNSNRNIVFYLNGIDERTYFKRFEEAFSRELTFLALGGEQLWTLK